MEGVAGWESLSKLKLLHDNQIFLFRKQIPKMTATHRDSGERRGTSLLFEKKTETCKVVLVVEFSC